MSLFDVLADGSSEEETMEDALSLRAFTAHQEIEHRDAVVAQAAKADPHAFGELYERYYTRVYRYVYHRVGNPSDAEDITALSFMKALEGLSTFQVGRSGFAPWLFRITRNSVVDHYRRRRNQTTLDELDHEVGGADPVHDVLGNERREELQALVRYLSPDQRDVILMRYAADLNIAEIAAALGKKEPAIRMLLHRGLRKLKAVLDNE
jgi:RNA polymerase sigma-70 factor (ECF subfamily)